MSPALLALVLLHHRHVVVIAHGGMIVLVRLCRRPLVGLRRLFLLRRLDGRLAVPGDEGGIQLVLLVPAEGILLQRLDHLRKRLAKGMARLPVE